MRVGILALLHESNTFIREPTTIEHFRQNLLLHGEPIREQLSATHHEIGGFFAGLDAAGIEAVPIFAARAVPYGTITAECFRELTDSMFAALADAGPLDGLLVAPHGATVSQQEPDADGYWLQRLRQTVGPRLPIIGTLDPHANLSPRMAASCNALIAYRSNPHLDQRERGLEAAAMIARTLRGEIVPTMAAAFPPLAINIERQLTSEPQCRTLYETANAMLHETGVLSNSIMLGFPYADVAEMGSSVLVVTDNDRAQAERLAGQLGQAMWQQRLDYIGHLISIDEALDRCAVLDGPICLLDMGDNAGGGSPADSTFLAHALNQRGPTPAVVCFYDPQAVAAAEHIGVGHSGPFALGGKTDDQHGQPLCGEFTVIGLYDGRFEEPEPRHGGFTRCDQGRSAVVRNERGLTILLTSRRMPPFCLRQLTSCGLDPTTFRVLVAKGVNAPVAAYAPICRHLIRVNTPGVTTADMESLAYTHRRRPLFPFECDTTWSP